MNFFVYQSKFKENRYPIYVITSEDPRRENEWNNPSYEKVFLGLFETYKEALGCIQNFELNFSHYGELDDSYLQGETVFTRV
ncbi:MAG: hypothetical protein IPH52_09740 [Leptospiraceae bacterium]|nr:hypothetical protein [Leptospiraceae bacterium]MBK7055319.1 hypothetical protein [Leptospiraceae bacterium]